MGLFGDIFKAKTNWKLTELQAVLMNMTAMGLIDGELDQDEINIIAALLPKLRGYAEANSNWETFIAGAEKMTPQEAFNILSEMHTDKKKIVVGLLWGVAQADGNVDDLEAEYINLFRTALKV